MTTSRTSTDTAIRTGIVLLTLATALVHLQLNFPELPWIKDLVSGLVLIVAVSITARAVKKRQTR